MESDFAGDIAAIQQIGAVPVILDVVCRMTGMGFAAVARVTEDRWIACSVRDDIGFGLKPGGELKVETTICDEIRNHREAVVIDCVASDEAYRSHPTPAQYGFQSYISMPIVLPGGRFFGTLCAIDPKPARLKTPEVIGTFKLFAELIGFHLDAIDRLAINHKSLMEERENSQLRERFIAVLSHDLLSPLTALDAEASALMRTRINDQGSQIVSTMKDTVRRMVMLVRDLRDFTRGRFGGGLPINRDGPKVLEPVLDQVVSEARAAGPRRLIEARFMLREPVYCDRPRIAQLLSNLLSNALDHGSDRSPVRVQGFVENGTLELSVSNSGDPIPEAVIPRLFDPFTRGTAGSNRQGLGLGLYIASEIARAHGGTLAASSSVEETRFTFRMPIRQAGADPKDSLNFAIRAKPHGKGD